MKKVTIIFSLLVLAILFSSCKKEQTLQGYLVESQDKKGFIAADIPASLLKISTAAVDSTSKANDALESIKKINIVAMPYKGNESEFEVEKNKLKSIFSNATKYKSLFSVKDKRANIKLYYLGDTENINEIVAFGYSKEMGIGIARLLGDNMQPGKIMEAMKDLNVDGNNQNLKELVRIFDGNKNIKVDLEKEFKTTE